ncbi:importin-4 [Anaeramoeba ignava]|uniref:Importin-4 n=1 Tax=Anaeramoeba ignava TaxID=1746090 RepID=A0A9Q0R8H2_ANAIG|nr:importin-4 [Anaeramoeba ignava]
MEISEEQMIELLSHILTPNSETISQAEQLLQELQETLKFSETLIQVILKDYPSQIRLLAATIFKKQIERVWVRFSKSKRTEIRNYLLQILAQETHIKIMKYMTYVVAEVAKIEASTSDWNELFDFVKQAIESENSIHKISALKIWGSLLESMGDIIFDDYFDYLIEILLKSFDNEDADVKLAAIETAIEMVRLQEFEQVNSMKKLVPKILKTIQFFALRNDDQKFTNSMEILDELMESEVPVITPFLLKIFQFVIEIANDQTRNIDIRTRVLTFIIWIVRYKTKFVLKHNFTENILKSIFFLAFDVTDQEIKQNDYEMTDNPIFEIDDLMSINKISYYLLETMAEIIPPVPFFDPVMKFIFEIFENKECTPTHQEVGLLSLIMISEGCFEMLRDILDKIIPIILIGLNSPNIRVQDSAFLVIANFSDTLQPEITEYHTQLMPYLLQSLEHQNRHVRYRTTIALESFVENLEKEITPYIEPLMSKLFMLLKQENSTKIHESVISTISSVSLSAVEKIRPYFSEIMQFLIIALQQSNDEMLQMRAKAMECAGIISLSAGQEHFKPYFNELMGYAMDGLSLEFRELTEYTYSFFGNLSDCLTSEFGSFYQEIIPRLLQTSNEKIAISRGIPSDNEDEDEDDEFQEMFDNEIKIGNDPFGIDEDENENDSKFVFETQIMNEKASTIRVLGLFAKNSPHHFLPFLSDSLESAIFLIKNYQENVRHNAIRALSRFVLLLEKPQFNSGQWVAGFPIQDKLPEKTAEIFSTIFPILIFLIENEFDSLSVAHSCEFIRKIVENFGPSSIESFYQEILDALASLLKEEAPCQQILQDSFLDGDDNEDEFGKGDEDDGFEDEDDEFEKEKEKQLENLLLKKHDIVVIDSVVDCVVAIIKALGESSAPFIKEIVDLINRYLDPQRSLKDQAMAIGAIAVMIGDTPELFRPIILPIIPLAIQRCKPQLHPQDIFFKQEEMLLRNSACCLGTIFFNFPEIQEVQNFVNDSLQLFYSLLEDHHLPTTRDNATSAIAKIMLKIPHQNLPIQKLIQAFLQGLPLQMDVEEAKFVYSCLAFLVLQHPDYIENSIPQIVEILVKVIYQKSLVITQDQQLLQIHKELIDILKKFLDLEQVAQLMNSLNDEIKNELLDQFEKFK